MSWLALSHTFEYIYYGSTTIINIFTLTWFFKFKIIIRIVVSSFCFIWIPMLWVHGHYKYFISFGAGNDFRRQSITSTLYRRQILTINVDPRTVRANLSNEISGSTCYIFYSIHLIWICHLAHKHNTDAQRVTDIYVYQAGIHIYYQLHGTERASTFNTNYSKTICQPLALHFE